MRSATRYSSAARKTASSTRFRTLDPPDARLHLQLLRLFALLAEDSAVLQNPDVTIRSNYVAEVDTEKMRQPPALKTATSAR